MFQKRLFHTARTLLQSTTESSAQVLPVAPTKVVYKKSRSGTFLGSLVGFLAGLSAAGSSGYWYLVEEYQNQAHALVASVDNVEKHVSGVFP